MQDTITQHLAGLPGETARKAVRVPMKAIGDRMSTQATSTAGLLITATSGNYVAKIGSVAFAGVVQGVPVAIAAGTDMPTLVGTITAGSYNIFCFFIDQSSTVTVAMGIEGTTLAKAKFPPFPEGKALVGYIIVTYASTFTGGSTALNTATTVYVSPVGAFDPTIYI
jgi:F420-0:gamma-glutamyl ligase-like protein